MKIIYIIMIITFMGCSCLDTNVPLQYRTLQSFNGDTVRYIKENFIINKQDYIGKDVNFLIDHLELPIHHFLPHIYTEKETVSGMTILFYSDGQRKTKVQNNIDPLVLALEWKESVPFDKIGALTRKNKLAWTEEEKRYIGKQVINNITLVKYN